MLRLKAGVNRFERGHGAVSRIDEDACCVADIPDLDSCSAFGETPQEALAEVLEARRAGLEVAREEGLPVPEPAYRPASARVGR